MHLTTHNSWSLNSKFIAFFDLNVCINSSHQVHPFFTIQRLLISIVPLQNLRIIQVVLIRRGKQSPPKPASSVASYHTILSLRGVRVLNKPSVAAGEVPEGKINGRVGMDSKQESIIPKAIGISYNWNTLMLMRLKHAYGVWQKSIESSKGYELGKQGNRHQ